MRHQAEPVHRHEDTVDAGEGNPEVEFAKRLVQAPAKKFWEPEKQRAKNCERGRDAHDEMEMAGDEIVADGSGGEIVAGQENSGDSAGKKKGNEIEREKDGGVEPGPRGLQSSEATGHENSGGRGAGRKQEAIQHRPHKRSKA